MKKKIGLMLLPAALVCAFLLAGCTGENDDPHNLKSLGLTGVFKSAYDGYTISATAFDYDAGDPWPGYPDYSFAGDVRHVVRFSDKAGVIIIKYTKKPEGPNDGAGGLSDYEGIYYTKIDADSVKFANAYDSGTTAVTTLTAAVDKFSQANESKLVSSGWDSVAVQKRQP